MTTKKALMYSKRNCTYCMNAEVLLHKRGYEIEKKMIDEDLDNRAELLDRVPGAKTVPQIFIDNNLIGSYNQLVEWFNQQDN